MSIDVGAPTIAGDPDGERSLDPPWRAQTVVANTAVLASARLSSVAASLILTPFLIRSLGIEMYGLWALISAIAGYLGLLDVGVGSSFVRTIAEYAAVRSLTKIRMTVTFGLVFYTVTGALVSPLAFLLVPRFAHALHMPADLVAVMQRVAAMVVGYFFLSNALSVFSAFLAGFQRLRTLAALELASRVAYVLVVIVVIRDGLGMYGLVLANVLQVTVLGCGCYVLVWRLFGWPLSGLRDLQRIVIARLFAFGGWMQITNVSGVVTLESDRLIIGGMIGLGSVTYYEIGNKVALFSRFLPEIFCSALLPSITALATTADRETLNDLYVRSLRLLACVAFAVSGLLIGGAELIVQVWFGLSYPYVPSIVAVLASAHVVNVLTGVGTVVMRALGRPRYEAQYAFLGMVVNVALTVALASRYGLYGVVAATAFATAASSIYFLCLFHRLRRLPFWMAVGRWLWRLVAAWASAIVAARYALTFVLPLVTSGKVPGFLALAALGTAYALALLLALWVTRFVTRADLATLLRRGVPPVSASCTLGQPRHLEVRGRLNRAFPVFPLRKAR